MNISIELQKFRFEIIKLTRGPVIESIYFRVRRISTSFPDAVEISVLLQNITLQISLLLRDNSAFDLFKIRRTFGAAGIKDDQGFQ